MAKFVQVDPSEFQHVGTTRGRTGVYRPILDDFIETGMVIGKINRKTEKRSAQSLYQGLRHHILQGEYPLKLFTRNGEVYLMRLDLNEDGSKNEDYAGPSAEEAQQDPSDVAVISPDSVREKSNKQRDTTK